VPLTGASVNPARTLGSAIVGDNYTDIWVYLTAPFLGAVLGWVLYRLVTSGTVDVRELARRRTVPRARTSEPSR
jgi:hypothetical protein